MAVKLAPLLTAFAHFARQLDAAGADGLVLFTRFHRVDIDVEELEVVRTLPLSDSSELPLRLRGTAALAGRVKASLAVTGGVHTGARRHQGDDGRRARDADGVGAPAARPGTSAHGPRASSRRGCRSTSGRSLDEMRGNMSFERIPDPAAYERANFRLSLRSTAYHA